MAKRELNGLPEHQSTRSPVPAMVVWVYSRAASLWLVRLHRWLVGLEANHSLRDVNEVAGLQRHVILGFTLVKNLAHIHDQRLLVDFASAPLTRDFDMMLVGEVGEAPGAEDGLAQRKDFVARKFLRPRHLNRTDQIHLA